ncbi:MAG: Crp/Fnr family transcriptional regulator [Hyphomicrobium sp.]|nr:Crp/Fnr family transcriptional regulator [Hyphomicrobium sp.]
MDESPFDYDLLLRVGAQPKTFDAGEKVFLEDDLGTGLYIIKSGRVDVITYGTVLENVRAGGIVGEVALIDGGPRSAAAIAAEPTEALSLDKPTFLALIREKPEFALHVMRVMAHRLRKMNEQL